MSNYTTQTASLKATTIDTRKIDTKQIDTKTLNINGISIDEKLKQAAIASRGDFMMIQFQDGVAALCVITVKDGQFLLGDNDERIICGCDIINNDFGDGEKKYLLITYENGDSVFNIGTTVNKVLVINASSVSEIKLKEKLIQSSAAGFIFFELGEVGDNLEEIYGGTFYNGYVYILYQDNALITALEPQNTSSTYSLRGENTSILDKLYQMVQQNS